MIIDRDWCLRAVDVLWSMFKNFFKFSKKKRRYGFAQGGAGDGYSQIIIRGRALGKQHKQTKQPSFMEVSLLGGWCGIVDDIGSRICACHQ